MNINDIMDRTINQNELLKAEKEVKYNVLAYINARKQQILFFSFKQMFFPMFLSCLFGFVIGLTNNNLNTNKELSVLADNSYSVILYDNIMEKINE